MNQDQPLPPSKDDILAILRAHRDLGPEFDNHLADQILDLWHESKRPNTPNRVQPNPFMRPMDQRRHERRHGFRSMAPIMALSIPLLAIAGGIARQDGVFAVLALDAVALIITSIRG